MTRGLLLTLIATLAPGLAQDTPPARVVEVVRSATITYSEDDAKVLQDGDFVIRYAGQVIQRTVELPPPPVNPAALPRITGRVRVEPICHTVDGRPVPNDPWNRLGSAGVMVIGPDGAPCEVELMRFVSPYGGPAVFEQDLTAFAPYLLGRRTFRVFLSSYALQPAWRISFELVYDATCGYRNPAFVAPLFNDAHVDGDGRSVALLTADVTIPRGLERPRIRILTTGHATDGTGEHEFISADHILKVDGREVAHWRPWVEGSTELRRINPGAARGAVGGQVVWASDFDRSGWAPGLVVEPMIIPVDELSPGSHRVQLEIRGLNERRRRTRSHDEGGHGYWVVSGTVVADRPWAPASGAREGP